MASVPQVTLAGFSMQRPAHEIEQSRALAWLTDIHVAAESVRSGVDAAELAALQSRTRRLFKHCACGAGKVGFRGHVVPDIGKAEQDGMWIYDLSQSACGKDIGARFRVFDDVVSAYFEAEYPPDHAPPSDLVHVTCTGYVAPSGAQKLVAKRGWGDHTRVTHAYHMGCYAALPALRLAAGYVSSGAFGPRRAAPRVDIAHTELCSLHLDPSDHSPEQLVVQSLFGDGLIRYSVHGEGRSPGLRLRAQHEAILSDSSDAMSWTATPWGMRMTLARDVPERIAGALRSFVLELCERADRNGASDLRRPIFAVHPGGPRVIDAVRDLLELDEAQVQTSRDVLFDYGNMSSATLPHVWMRLVASPEVRAGTPIVSLAFGPGLTVCGAVFCKT